MSRVTPASHHHTRTISRMDAAVEAASPSQTSPSANRGKKRKAESPKTESMNARIAKLTMPSRDVAVAKLFSNDKNAQNHLGGVQAYAKLAGSSWTYYVKKLKIIIGREPEQGSTGAQMDETIDIDLGPAKVVSRRHLIIEYDLQEREWMCTVVGRNGIKIDAKPLKEGRRAVLRSMSVLEIGGVQMMFVLPEEQSHFSTEPSSDQPETGFPAEQETLTSPKNEKSLQPGDITVISCTVDQLALEENREIKPPFSYATMIAQAILSVPEQRMTLSNIYQWITDHYAYYRHIRSGWQNSIRHNLSLNKAFEKVPRASGEPGKGMKWQIGPEFRDEFTNKARVYKVPRRPGEEHVSPHRSPNATPKRDSIHIPPMTPTNEEEDFSRPSMLSNVKQDSSNDIFGSIKRRNSMQSPVGNSSYPLSTKTPERELLLQRTALPSSASPSKSGHSYPISSPAPFWRYTNFTPLRDYSLNSTQPQFSSPVRPSQTPNREEPGRESMHDVTDLQGVDLAKGFDDIEWKGEA